MTYPNDPADPYSVIQLLHCNSVKSVGMHAVYVRVCLCVFKRGGGWKVVMVTFPN